MEQLENTEPVEREIVVPASPDEAWRALTEPELLTEWLADEVDFDLRPGGELRVRVGDVGREGFVEEVDAPRRLVFWWAQDDEEASRVEIDITEADGATRVRVVESRPLLVLDTGEIPVDSEFRGGASQPEMSAALSLTC